MAEQTLCSASRLFHHAVGRRLINANPCAEISLDAIKGAKPLPRKRVMLTPGELHEILSKVDAAAGRKYGLIPSLPARDLRPDRRVRQVEKGALRYRQKDMVGRA